jgi:hypothetical protein
MTFCGDRLRIHADATDNTGRLGLETPFVKKCCNDFCFSEFFAPSAEKALEAFQDASAKIGMENRWTLEGIQTAPINNRKKTA